MKSRNLSLFQGMLLAGSLSAQVPTAKDVTLTAGERGPAVAGNVFTAPPVLQSYSFDVVGNDGAAMAGWIDTIGTTGPSSLVFSSAGANDGGRGTGGFFNSGGDQDAAHPSAVMSSPPFQLQDQLGITFQIAGGEGTAAAPSNLASVPEASSGTGFQGVGLRRLSDNAYVLTIRRSGNGNGFQNRGWTAEQLATVNAANPGANFVLDWIDSYDGSWGFGMIDNVKFILGSGTSGVVPLKSPPTLVAGQSGYDGTLAATLDDGFAYNPLTPANPLPNQAYGANIGFHNASGNTPAILIYDLVTPLLIGPENQMVVDLYGRNANKERDNNIDVAFLADDASVLGELKGQVIPDTGAAMLRISSNNVVPVGSRVAKIRITGNDSDADPVATNNFTLLELRAANLQKAYTNVPPAVTAVNGNAASVGQEITLPSGALLTMDANGAFQYNANGAINVSGTPGSDSFAYTINFPGGNASSATVTATIVDSDLPIFVNDDWAALAAGAAIADADAGTAGNQPAVFGTNAFATIQAAVLKANIGGRIILHSGSYNEAVGLSNGKSLVIGGPDAAQSVAISNISTAAASDISLQGASTLSLGKGSLEGRLIGSGGLEKTSDGLLTLSGDNSLTGPVVLDGGTLAFRGTADLGTGQVSVASPTTLQVNAELMLPNAISGTEDIWKTGNGNLALTGTLDSLTGFIGVEAGGLEISAGTTFGGSVEVNSGAEIGGEGTISGDLILGTVDGGGARLAIDPGSAGSLRVNGKLTLDGVVTVVGLTETEVVVPMIRYGTVLEDFSGAVGLSSAFLSSAGGRSLVVDNAKTLTIEASKPESIVFTAVETDAWQVGGPDANWNSSDEFFSNRDDVTFDDSADAASGNQFSGTVTAMGNPMPSSITFNNTIAREYTLNGEPVRGDTGLVKNNGGTVNLTSPQDFTGEVVINGGVLKQDSIFRNVSGVKISSEGTFITSAVNIFVPTHGDPVPDDMVIEVDGGTWIADEQHDARVGNVILANGATWRSDRPLTLHDLLIANTTAGPATVKVTGTGASLMTGDGISGLHLQGLPVFDVADTSSSPQADLLVSMVLDDSGSTGGAGGFRKKGPGTMFLSAANTYDDIAYVDEGILSIEDYTVIPNSDYSRVHVAAGAGFGGIVGAANLTDVDLEEIAENVVWAGNGTSRLVLDTNGKTVEVGIDFAGRGFQIYAQGGGTLNLTGNATGVLIANDGATTVNSDSPAPIQVGVSRIVTSAGTAPGTLKTSIAFTTDGSVDVYASDDLADWGAPIASGLGAAASPFIEDNIAAGGTKRFYVLVGAGSPPPTP